jgi:hypothetical protein
MKFIRELLREEPARFDIDTSGGRSWWIGQTPKTDRAERVGHARAGERNWGQPTAQDPEARRWSITTGSGKVLYSNLKKADAEAIARGRKDLVSKYGALKVVYNHF